MTMLIPRPTIEAYNVSSNYAPGVHAFEETRISQLVSNRGESHRHQRGESQHGTQVNEKFYWIPRREFRDAPLKIPAERNAR